MKRILLMVLVALPLSILAQEKTQPKEEERIIITRKGGVNEKMSIVVDGENITVNGKAIGEEGKGNITVKRMKIKDADNFYEMPIGTRGNRFSFPMEERELQITGTSNKAMLGVLTEKDEKGARIVSVNENTAAMKAGLKEGDIITEVDAKKISTPDELSEALKDKKPGDKVNITFLRDGKTNVASAELTKREMPQIIARNGRIESQRIPIPDNFFNGQAPYQGLENLRNFKFREMPDFYFGAKDSGPRLGVQVQETEAGNGVKVIRVEKGSDADKAGVKEGDVLKMANGKEIATTGDIIEEVKKSKPGSSIKLKLDRDGRTQNVTVTFSKELKSANL